MFFNKYISKYYKILFILILFNFIYFSLFTKSYALENFNYNNSRLNVSISKKSDSLIEVRNSLDISSSDLGIDFITDSLGNPISLFSNDGHHKTNWWFDISIKNDSIYNFIIQECYHSEHINCQGSQFIISIVVDDMGNISHTVKELPTFTSNICTSNIDVPTIELTTNNFKSNVKINFKNIDMYDSFLDPTNKELLSIKNKFLSSAYYNINSSGRYEFITSTKPKRHNNYCDSLYHKLVINVNIENLSFNYKLEDIRNIQDIENKNNNNNNPASNSKKIDYTKKAYTQEELFELWNSDKLEYYEYLYHDYYEYMMTYFTDEEKKLLLPEHNINTCPYNDVPKIVHNNNN